MSTRKNKSKEEIEEGIKRVQEAKRMRAFVKDKFYPALMLASASVDDAKYLLTSFSNVIMEEFMKEMKTKKILDLKLHERLDKKSPNYKQNVELLALFSDESVFASRELIEGMKGEIEMMITNEMKERKLDTLKTNFLE